MPIDKLITVYFIFDVTYWGATHIMKYTTILMTVMVLLITNQVFAESDAEFPTGWDSWPVHHSGTILGKDTAIPDGLPPIVIETVKTYNWVQDGKGSAYNVRINPAKTAGLASYDFGDGPTAVLELTDIKVLLVTDHLVGEEQYGVYTYDGKDISSAHPSLATQVCATCHSGYGDACVKGVCTKK